MDVVEHLARLTAGRTLTDTLAGKGGRVSPLKKRATVFTPSTKKSVRRFELDATDIAAAAGSVDDPLMHGLILRKFAEGPDRYVREKRDKNRVTEPLKKGVQRMALDIARDHRRDVHEVVSNVIAGIALSAWYGERVSQERIAAELGVSRRTWARNYAIHYQEILAEMFAREADALRQMGEKIWGSDWDWGRNGA